ncbi:MAG: CPBP family intramembrane glutamic endopeptidase [Anaerolineaceae bacterium]
MITAPDKKRIKLYLGFAFGIAWLTCLVIYLKGGLTDSPVIVPALNLTLATLLLSTGMMGAPALANLFTRLITHEGKQELWLKPARFNKPWRYWLLAWILPAVGTLAGAAVYFLIFPGSFDRNLENIQALLVQQGAEPDTLSITPWLIVVSNVVQSVLLAPILNALPTFGEEAGWRGYLLPKLLPLGQRKAVLISGVTWGMWHWPVIVMGHNYGLDYAGFPWLGMLAMIWFTIVIGTLFSWLTLKEGSIWPAVIGHGAINGIAGIGLLVQIGAFRPLLGPTPTGLIGGACFSLLAMILLLRKDALQPGQEQWKSEPILPDNFPDRDKLL